MMASRPTGKPEAGSQRSATVMATLVVPFVLWPIVFSRTLTDFWAGLSFATAILLAISVGSNRHLSLRTGLRWILLGLASGFVLYGGFYIGYQVTKGIAGFSGGVSSVYGLKTDRSLLVIALLLIFPIGPGEEIYWRGFIQRSLAGTGRREYAWVLQAIPYTLIHLFTLNPPLLITALIGGLGWGYLYKLSGCVTPSILSHVIFDLLIFVILPFS